MESILEYHIRNIKERTGIEFIVEEGSTWENPSLRYHAAKELFHASEDKTGIATVEDCYNAIKLQKETFNSKIKNISRNAVQIIELANLVKGDLEDNVNTWLGDLRKAKEKDEIAFETSNELGYLIVLHGGLTILLGVITNSNVADNVRHYRQTLKNNIVSCHNLLNMERAEWLRRTWIDTLCNMASQRVHLLNKDKQ